MALVQAGTAGVQSLGRAPPPHGASPAGSLRTTCPRGPRALAACCRLPRTACGPCRVGQAAVAASRAVRSPASSAWWCGRRCSSRSGRPRLAPPSQVRSGWGRAGWAGALRVRAPQPPPVRESSCARVPGRRSWPCAVQGPSSVGACVLIAFTTVEGSSRCNLARPVRA